MVQYGTVRTVLLYVVDAYQIKFQILETNPQES